MNTSTSTPIPEWAWLAANELAPLYGVSFNEEHAAQIIASSHTRATQEAAVKAATTELHLSKVRAALVGLVGVDTPEELHQMKGAISVLTQGAPQQEQAPILAAIDALLEVRSSS